MSVVLPIAFIFEGPAAGSALLALLALTLAALFLMPLIVYRLPRGLQLTLGSCGVTSSALALWLFALAWPIDWLGTTPPTPMQLAVGSYSLHYVQYPGIDFYADALEIVERDQPIARIYLNVDNYKCWVGTVMLQGDQVRFACWPWDQSAELSLAWLHEQLAHCAAQDCDMSAAYDAWLADRH